MPAWEPPSHYDVLRELNAQAGRLATVVGLLVAAVTVGVGGEPYRVAFSLPWAPGRWNANALALCQAVDLGCCIIAVLFAVLEALPEELDSEDAWRRQIARRQEQLLYSKIALVVTVVALLMGGELTATGGVNTFVIVCNVCLSLGLLVLGAGPGMRAAVHGSRVVGRYARAWALQYLRRPGGPSRVP